MSSNLGIRAHRSQRTRVVRQKSAITDHTLDDDLPNIRKYAQMYENIDEKTKEVLANYILPGKTLDYYHGSYITAFQIFTMAYMSENEIAPSLMAILHAVSRKIVDVMDAAQKNIKGAESIGKVNTRV
jgi:hypothetical protein